MAIEDARPPAADRARWIILAAAIATSALTARLGVWQLDRAAQKQERQSQLDQRRTQPALPPADLARDEGSAVGQYARAVQLEGRWLPAGTVYLDNRQMKGRPGFFVVTPLLIGPGDAVMVQRGWLPRDLRDRTRLLPVATPTDKPVKVEGRVAPPPTRLYDFNDAGSGPIRQNLDLDLHARQLGVRLRPISIVQTGPADPPSENPDAPALLRDWPAPAADVAKHHGYAAQWFALSALSALLYVWFQILRPRRPRRTTG